MKNSRPVESEWLVALAILVRKMFKVMRRRHTSLFWTDTARVQRLTAAWPVAIMVKTAVCVKGEQTQTHLLPNGLSAWLLPRVRSPFAGEHRDPVALLGRKVVR